jgi:hypothetical protein
MSDIQPGPSPNVRHGRYLRFDWPAARLSSARAYSAVRHGGPTTFKPDPPAKHAGSSCHLSAVRREVAHIE